MQKPGRGKVKQNTQFLCFLKDTATWLNAMVNNNH